MYAWAAGTSMATPHVSGTIALILSLNSTLRPEVVKFILYSTAMDKGLPGYDIYYGFGVVNPYRALKLMIKLGLAE